MNIVYRYFFIAVLCIAFPINAISCETEFDGGQFLEESHNSGIRPESTCYVVDLNENTFFSYPDKSCKLIFSNDSWLKNEWSFNRIQGGGTFTSQKSEEGIVITIDAAGGFRLNSIILSSDSVSCDGVIISEVL